MNPITSRDAGSFSVYSGLVYETLIELDNETLEYVPHLAERWEVSDDHLTYTFYLRKDVKWQDGEPFTSGDIVFSFQKLMDPRVDAAPGRTVFQDIETVEALGPHAVRFRYKKPYFRAFSTCGSFPIVPRHIFDDGRDFNSHPANRSPVGTGPFMFKEWKTKQHVVLVKNPNYWGKPVEFDGIVFKIIEDSTVLFQELKKGNLDMSNIRAIQWEKGTGGKAFTDRFDKAQYFLPNYSYIGWNMRRPYFSDKRVRLAMSMMIRRDEILSKLLFGHAVAVEGDQYYFGEGYDHNIEPPPFDPEGAKKLLDEAGWVDHDGDGIRDKDGVPFRFTFSYRAEHVFGGQLATILREDLSKIGIVMDIRGLEFNALYKFIEQRSFDAALLAWAMPLENDPYQLWHSSQSSEGSNFVGFENRDADRIIESVRTEFDKEKRNVLFRELQMILHEEQPYAFLFNPATLLAYSRRFGNVKIYKFGPDIREWTVGRNIAVFDY